MPKVDFDFRIRRERAQVGFLANGLVWIIGASYDLRCEILDLRGRRLFEDQAAKLFKIKPFEAGAPQSAVVQIEPIYVHEGPQDSAPNVAAATQSEDYVAARPAAEATGVIWRKYSESGENFKNPKSQPKFPCV